MYKKIQEFIPRALTFNFNIDGAQLFKSAKKSLWPLQFHFNELPPQIRFKHLIVAGLRQTEIEFAPEFINLFLSTFVQECENLATEGIKIFDHKTKKYRILKIVPLFGCLDTVAFYSSE